MEDISSAGQMLGAAATTRYVNQDSEGLSRYVENLTPEERAFWVEGSTQWAKAFAEGIANGDLNASTFNQVAKTFRNNKLPGAVGGDSIFANRTFVDRSNGAIVRPADSPNYSAATEVQLPPNAYPGVSRRRHNQISNQALHEVFETDPAFATRMENLYPGIVDGVRPGSRGAFPDGRPTPDVTWHHGTEPGQMQLVPRDQHIAPGPVQDSLHPGPNRGGGFADWGTE